MHMDGIKVMIRDSKIAGFRKKLQLIADHQYAEPPYPTKFTVDQVLEMFDKHFGTREPLPVKENPYGQFASREEMCEYFNR